MRKIDYSYKILEKMLTLKPFDSREEVLDVAKKMIEIAKKKGCDSELMAEYEDAYDKLQSIETFDEMKNLISMLSNN